MNPVNGIPFFNLYNIYIIIYSYLFYVCSIKSNYLLFKTARAGDSGWAGIAFNPKNFNSVVTSHLPSKAITIYDIQVTINDQIYNFIDK